MIALPSALPLIRFGAGTLAVCQPEWLTQTLEKATEGTNIPSWIAEDICKGIKSYLENHYPGTVIDSEELFQRIRETLEKVGMNEVAENLDHTLPPVRISLDDLASEAGNGFELAFFQLLGSQVNNAAEGGAESIEFFGLKQCVKQLASSKKWSEKCETLKGEITVFIDEEVNKAAHHMPSFSMQVHH